MIYIVNRAVSGYYAELYSSYHLVESEAQAYYEETLLNVGEDPAIVELVRVDLNTLEAVTLKSFDWLVAATEDEDAHEEDEDPSA
jgi:hypothetical protein